MRLIAIALLVALGTGPAFAAQAQEHAEQVAPEQQSDTLDQLFGQLRHEPRQAAASRIARQIWSKWADSGSATINLLMTWATKAMREKKYPLAEDLLTQVTVLAPDYAEGWNRRATLYFVRGEYGRAIRDIERTLQLEPRHFGALSGLGVILTRMGSDRKALETWYKVLAIYPANRDAQKAVVNLEDKLVGQAS
jgi:tetratricopeptide (TPR) repeat protein